MTIDNYRYETWELDELVRTIRAPATFLRQRYFTPGGEVFSTSPQIEWDIEEGGRRIAPFVSPWVPGRSVESRGHMSAFLKPAYVKPAKTLTPQMALVRRPGENYGGNLTPRQRMDLLLANQIREHEEMVENRLEWMAAKALHDGSITISGEDYQSVVVDFGRHADLEPATLSGTARWSQSTGLPLDDIETTAQLVNDRSYGAVVDDVVMDFLAWGYFRKRMEANVNFSTQWRLGNSSIDSGPLAQIDEAVMVGTLAGRFNIWVYGATYENDEGATTKFMADNTAMLISSKGIQGKTYFGAIQDLEADLQSMRMFHKTWVKKDPSGLHLLSQSAPVLAPKRRNASARLIVHQ